MSKTIELSTEDLVQYVKAQSVLIKVLEEKIEEKDRQIEDLKSDIRGLSVVRDDN